MKYVSNSLRYGSFFSSPLFLLLSLSSSPISWMMTGSLAGLLVFRSSLSSALDVSWYAPPAPIYVYVYRSLPVCISLHTHGGGCMQVIVWFSSFSFKMDSRDVFSVCLASAGACQMYILLVDSSAGFFAFSKFCIPPHARIS